MASDNILSALVGVLEGSQKGVNMFLQDTLDRRRLEEGRQSEFDIYKQKQPIELQQKQAISDYELGNQKSLSQFRTDIEPQVPLYNTATGTTVMPPEGTKKFDTFTPTVAGANGGEPSFFKSELLKMPLLERMKLPKYTVVDDTAEDRRDLQNNIPGYVSDGTVRIDGSEAKKLRDGLAEFNNFMDGINEYRALIDQYGTTEVLDREGAAKLKSVSKNLQLKVKNLAQLGVLSFSDIPFIEEQIPKPGIFTTDSGTLGALDATENLSKKSLDNQMKARGYRKAGSGGRTPEEEAEYQMLLRNQ